MESQFKFPDPNSVAGEIECIKKQRDIANNKSGHSDESTLVWWQKIRDVEEEKTRENARRRLKYSDASSYEIITKRPAMLGEFITDDDTGIGLKLQWKKNVVAWKRLEPLNIFV